MVNVINSLRRKAKNIKAKNKKVKIKTDIEILRSAFDKVFPKMTKEEQDENLGNYLCGMWINEGRGGTILMGSDAMDRYLNFQNEMVKKYSV